MSDIYLYVIGREDGPVKIGISNNVYGRALTLQTGCPFEIEVFHLEKMRDRQHAVKHEGHMHELFGESRLHGEWFQIDAELAVEQVVFSVEIEQEFANRRRLERVQ